MAWRVVFEGKATKTEIWESWTIIDLYQCIYLLDHAYIEQSKQYEQMQKQRR